MPSRAFPALRVFLCCEIVVVVALRLLAALCHIPTNVIFAAAAAVAAVAAAAAPEKLPSLPIRNIKTTNIMAAATSNETKQRWFPLESNPALMNDYVQKLGFNTDLYNFVDVYTTEDWALEMIPQPVAAVIMLYPLTPKQLEHEKDSPDAAAAATDDSLWFIKQRIGNACGTIGLLHSLLNTPEPLCHFRSGSWLDTFQDSCPASLDPVRKAEILEGDADIATLHDTATSSEENQTGRGRLDDRLVTHFVAFVAGKDNTLYELDGRKSGPVAHGKTTQATLLLDACKVVKDFMARDPEEIRFTILALAPKQD